jgi:signal transduction histidine kinase
VSALSRLVTWTESPLKISAVIVSAFVVAGSAKFLIVTVLVHLHVPQMFLRLQDAILTGALAAILVLTVLLAVASRRKRVQEELQTIAMLNHEIRNALEVIIGSDYLPQSEQAAAIIQSVDRINRTLKGLLGPKMEKF